MPVSMNLSDLLRPGEGQKLLQAYEVSLRFVKERDAIRLRIKQSLTLANVHMNSYFACLRHTFCRNYKIVSAAGSPEFIELISAQGGNKRMSQLCHGSRLTQL